MKLDKFHVDQLRAGVISERVSVTGVLPAVARDFVSAPNSASGKNDGFSAEDFEAAAFTLVTKRSDHAFAFLQQ